MIKDLAQESQGTNMGDTKRSGGEGSEAPWSGGSPAAVSQSLIPTILLVALVGVPAPLCRTSDAVRRDLYGDPLPPGAHALLGTLRLRGGAALAFSPDGESVAASSGGKVRFWSLGDGHLLAEIEAQADSLEFSPDGKVLACGYERRVGQWEVALLDVGTRQQTRVLAGGHLVAFSPNGKTLAAAEPDGSVNLYHGATGAGLGKLSVEGFVASLSFSNDSRSLAIGTLRSEAATLQRGSIYLWNVSGGAMPSMASPRKDTGIGRAPIAFSPDLTLAVIAQHPGTVSLWDVTVNQERARLPLSQGDLRYQPAYGESADGYMHPLKAAFSPTGETLALATYGDLRLCDASTGRETRRIQAHDAPITSLRFSRDGSRLASSGGRILRIWGVQTGEPLLPTPGHVAPMLALAFSRDGKLLASASEDKSARLWDVTTGRQVLELRRHSKSVTSVAVSLETHTIVTGTWNDIHFWDITTGEHRAMVHAHDGWVHGMPVFPGGRTLATVGDYDPVVRLWDIATAKCKLEFKAAQTRGADAVLSSDGERFLSFFEKDVRLWEHLDQARCPSVSYRLIKNWVTAIALSADGRRMASSSIDGPVSFWDMTTRARIGRFLPADVRGPGRGSQEVVDSLAISSDGTLVAWAVAGIVEIYNLRDHQVVAAVRNYTGQGGRANRLAFSPDDNLLACGYGDGQIVLWDVHVLENARVLSGTH